MRRLRQTVAVDFGDPRNLLVFPGLSQTEEFMVGDVFPVESGDGTVMWRVSETHRRDTLAPDGEIERDWVLKVEAVD